MKGIKIKCPNCKVICFETTESFNPNVTPNGGMVRKLSNVPWEIDWLMASTTTAAEMVCPMCGVGQLAPSGRLTLVEPVPPFVEPEEIFTIEVGEDEPEAVPEVKPAPKKRAPRKGKK
jgi:hypothetical protein